MRLSMKKTVFVASLGLALAGSNSAAVADSLVLTFVNSTAVSAKPGACSSIPWTAGAEFRMCDIGGALGGGLPLQKNTISGGETYTFSDAGVLTGITGTTTNPGATFAGSAAPTAGTNVTWQQNANFFGGAFNFLAPASGSLAGAAYGNATYIGGVPTAGTSAPFILAPVLEAQWGNTWFPLGQTFTVANGIDAASGITFTADITNVTANTVTHVLSFDFHMYANECIDGGSSLGCTTGGGGEDPGSAGFGGWTAEWHMQGTGSYTDTTAPSLSSTSPTNGATEIATNTASYDVTFSEPMAVGSITSGFITISGGVTVGPPTASNSDKTFSFPITSGDLAGSTTFTVEFNADPTDFAGNAVTLPDRSFTTAAGADSIAPTITTRSPVSGATGVSITTTIAVTFDPTISVAMRPATAGSITVVKTSDSSSVAGLVTTSDNTTFTFTPTSDLAYLTQYTVTVAAATAEDAAGNNLAANDSWSFTTADSATATIADLKTEPLSSGCTISPRAKFDPTLLAMLLGSFGWLAWRRRRNH